MLKIYKYKDQIKKRANDLFSFISFKIKRAFWGTLIRKGKKIMPFNFFLNLKYEIKIKEQVDPDYLFLFSILKVIPTVITYPFKVGGAIQPVPLHASLKKKIIYANKWFFFLVYTKNKLVPLKLASDTLISCLYNKGPLTNKISNHKSICISNRFMIRNFRNL